LNIAQAGGAAVDQVFAFAGAIQAARDGDLGGLRRRGSVDSLKFVRGAVLIDFRVDQRHGDVCHAERFAVARAGENHVLHAGSTKALGRLFAQYPAYGVADIRLAAAVGTDDGGDALAVESELGALAKGLESL